MLVHCRFSPLVCVASLAIGTAERRRSRRCGRRSPTTATSATSGSCTSCGSPAPPSRSLVGVALGLSGTLIQSVGRNPLADAEILGINSGAALFIVTAIALLGVTGPGTYIWFGFAGALFAMVLVYLIGMTGRPIVTPVRVLLAGVAIGAVMDGIGFVVRLRYPRAFDNMRFWDAGALDGRSLVGRGRHRPVHRGRRRAVHRRRALSQRRRTRGRSRKEHGRQRRPHAGAQPGRRHPARRRGHRRRGPDRLRRADGPARGAAIHRSRLAMDPRAMPPSSHPRCCWPPTSSAASSSGPPNCRRESSPRSSAHPC